MGRDKQAETLAARLRGAIEASGLSSYALATLSGVNVEVIRRFRQGTRDLRLETAGEIAAALGMPPLAWPRKWPDPPNRKNAGHR